MNDHTFDSLRIGQKEGFSRRISHQDIEKFSELSGDINPLHLDSDFAVSMGYEKKVGFGMLASSFYSTLAGVYLPGKYSLIVKEESSFYRPFFEGDTLKIEGEIKDKKEFGSLIFVDTKINNQDAETIVKGKMIIKVLK